MIFKDEALNLQLASRGYVIVPLLSEEEVEKLRAVYAGFESQSPYFHSTTFFKDIALKQQLFNEVKQVFAPEAGKLLTPHKFLGASFLTKPGGQGGFMPVHQDWTIVDESRFVSCTIWVPLQDVDENKGALMVLDGSHRLTPILRAPSLPVVIKDIEPHIRKQMKTLRMKSGEAFVFNQALVHASHLNSTANNRIAVTYGLVPQQAQLFFYHLDEAGDVDCYEVEDDFFLKYDNHGERPTFVQPARKLKEDFTSLSAQHFNLFLQRYKSEIMKPLFKDSALQQQYERDGYVLLDMLNEMEVKELKDYYNTLNNDHIPDYGFHVSLDNRKPDFVMGVMDKIKTVISGPADKYFTDYKIFTSSYVVKEKNPIGVVPPHQDWSFTEEDEGYNSATIWTALVDTDMYNGEMGVIVGSHKFFNHHRCSPAPQFKTPLDTHVFSIFPYLKLIPMKPGQALVFDNRTVHASPPNVSDGVRLAVGFGVTQKDAPLRHYYLVPGSDCKKLNKYEVDDFFFTHYNNARLSEMYNSGKLPEDLNLLEVVDNRVQYISADELLAKIKEAGNTFNIEMCEHLAKLFNYNMDGSQKQEPTPEIIQEEVTVVEEQPAERPMLEEPEEQVLVQQDPVVQQGPTVDGRSFFQKYTPLNILREIKHRVTSDNP
ncbi:MAG: phytanoyl-CoA dioxygenase family protein [Chitinophagales bacterium]